MTEQATLTRRAMIDDEAVKTLIENLLTALPDRVQEARETLVDAEHDLEYFTADKDAQETVEQLKLEAEYEAAQDVDENGKKKNTNDAQRKAAAAKILANDAAYSEAVAQHRAARQQKHELTLRVGKLRNQLFYTMDLFKAHMSLARLVGGLCHESEVNAVLETANARANRLAAVIESLKEGLSDV